MLEQTKRISFRISSVSSSVRWSQTYTTATALAKMYRLRPAPAQQHRFQTVRKAIQISAI